VTGLVFAKLFFPKSDPLTGTLEAFAIYAVGFVARPIGAAIFGRYGDRIGRKSTLIATLMLMGLATFAVALVRPTSRSASGARSCSPSCASARRRCRQQMGRLGAAVDGMGAFAR
jgi:MFS family permease